MPPISVLACTLSGFANEIQTRSVRDRVYTNSFTNVLAPATFSTVETAVAHESAERTPAETTQAKIFAAVTEQVEEPMDAQSATASFSDIALSVNVPQINVGIDTADILSSLLPTRQHTIKTIERDINLDDYETEDQLASLSLLEPAEFEANENRRVTWQSENIELKNSLEKLSENLKQISIDKQTGTASSIESLVGVSIGITSGFLAWVLRGGALLASVFFHQPALATARPTTHR